MVFDGTAAPSIGRNFLLRRGQAKLRRRVVRPQRAALGAERASTARHAGRRLGHFELRVAAMAASLDRHGLIPFLNGKVPVSCCANLIEPCCQHGVSIDGCRAAFKSGLSFLTTRLLLMATSGSPPGSRSLLLLNFLFVLIVGLVAGTVSGIVGTGSSIMLMPVLVYQYGPKEAVPIMAVAAVMANLSRILAWWREVDWRACAAYSIPGIPAAALGAKTLLVLPSRVVDIAIGLFLIAMVPVRHWLARHHLKARLWHLALGGAVIGYLTGIVVSTGPLSVPLFLFYGLTRGAFLATEAASSLGMYLSKSVTFQRFGALTPEIALQGIIAGASLMSGAFIAKRFVLRLEPEVFRRLMDAIMLVAGLSTLWTAAFS